MGTLPIFSFDAKNFLKSLTDKPGVYFMLDADQKIIYVGKAKQLKKRLASYFKKNQTDIKTAVMVKQIADIKVTVTHNENEALILENTLIKQHKPRYNVVFRDDKTYPYICFSDHNDFPRLYLVRGKPEKKDHYFGPYPNTFAARESLHVLQKLFQLRQCTNHFFQNRTRPCLQYQIKRCSAPCVGYIEPIAYRQQVQHAMLFLQGKNKRVMTEMLQKMETAAENLHFEQAAVYRDQIEKLRTVLTQQNVSNCGDEDVDVLSVVTENHLTCVEILFIRAGRLLGNRSYFPKVPDEMNHAAIVREFIPQYYLGTAHQQDIPARIIVDVNFDDMDWLASGLTEQAGHTVQIIAEVQGTRERWRELATTNAKQALAQRLSDKLHMRKRFAALQAALGLLHLPQRLECFDISHTQGEATVASCVVFDTSGPLNSAYRRFNIKDVTKGDD
jgi:excinuclease ABC subunit C